MPRKPDADTNSYIREMGNTPLLTREEEIALAKMIERGKKAEKRLTEANLRLVVSIAKRYHKIFPCFTMLDLIQEGNCGLLDSVNHFDWRRGLKFSTFATWKIRGAITTAITKALRGTNKEKSLSKLMADKKSTPPYAEEDNRMLGKTLQEAISVLSLTTQRILELRFGLAGNFPKSIREISKEMGISRNRVYERIKGALAKLSLHQKLIRLNE